MHVVVARHGAVVWRPESFPVGFCSSAVLCLHASESLQGMGFMVPHLDATLEACSRGKFARAAITASKCRDCF